MPDRTQPTSEQHVSSLAANPACASNSAHEGWENEGGHVSSRFGRIVHNAAGQLPYKVILSHDQGTESEGAFATMAAPPSISRGVPMRRKATILFLIAGLGVLLAVSMRKADRAHAAVSGCYADGSGP